MKLANVSLDKILSKLKLCFKKGNFLWRKTFLFMVILYEAGWHFLVTYFTRADFSVIFFPVMAWFCARKYSSRCYWIRALIKTVRWLYTQWKFAGLTHQKVRYTSGSLVVGRSIHPPKLIITTAQRRRKLTKQRTYQLAKWWMLNEIASR